LYGATGGEIFLNGCVGERFGVRNAGCHAVIEGAGDHLGEYMTNGVIVSLGEVGRNIAAGMSGGLLYLYDPDRNGLKVNVDNDKNVFPVSSEAGQEQLRGLIQKHLDQTGSRKAAEILDDWSTSLGCFWQVAPVSTHQSEFVAVPAEGGEAVKAVASPVAAAAKGGSSRPGASGQGAWGGSGPSL